MPLATATNAKVVHGGAAHRIGNKIKRAQVFAKQRLAKEKARTERRAKRKREAEELGDAAPPKQVPKTLESTRTADDTVVAAGDPEVAADEADDEFAPIFRGELQPKVMVTTQRYPSAKVFPLIGELLGAVPNAFYYRRQHYQLKQISGWAAEKGFTHLVVVVVERGKAANTLIVCKLPDGPTGCFKFSSPLLSKQIEGHGARTEHVPEIILNGFTTRLGRRIGRLLGSLFPHQPNFTGRQVVTFHNQRDFIFFRQHRYMFREGGAGAALQELGPRFTLKPQWLLAGGFDPLHGEYEMLYRRAEHDLSRRTFML